MALSKAASGGSSGSTANISGKADSKTSAAREKGCCLSQG